MPPLCPPPPARYPVFASWTVTCRRGITKVTMLVYISARENTYQHETETIDDTITILNSHATISTLY